MKLHLALPAGVLDAALASLATFVIGAYAAHTLPPDKLGAYALFFAAFFFATSVPTQLLLAPAEFATVALSRVPRERLSLVCQTWRFGAPAAGIASIGAVAAAWLIAVAPLDVRLSLAFTAVACGTVSPLQDHVRRVLHMSGASWCAALVSLVQLGAAVGALALLRASQVATVWHPLGALAVANTLSLAAGVALVRRQLDGASLPPHRLRRLVGSGRWLLLQEVALTGGSFAAAALVTRLAGSSALGHAEAARIVAAPLYTMAVGLGLVLNPRSAEAGAAGRAAEARRISRTFTAVLFVGGVLFGVVTAVPWFGNPLAVLVPKAYESVGLVPVTLLGYLLLSVPVPLKAELIGAGRERSLPRVAVRAGVAQGLASCSAAWIGAFARPVSAAVFGAVSLLGYRVLRVRLYADGDGAAAPAAATPAEAGAPGVGATTTGPREENLRRVALGGREDP